MENKIIKYQAGDIHKAYGLFAGWDKAMIRSCLQDVMGGIYAPNTEMPKSAAAQINDFCFLAGEPIADLITYDYGRDFLIMAPQSEAWEKLIEAIFGDKAVRRIRYAVKKDPACFDKQHLLDMANSLPKQYEINYIDRTIYRQCLDNDWSADLVSGFRSFNDFERLGLGFVVTENGIIVSGASSYSRYREGIEIEVDTKAEYRRKGLATAVSATLILECLDRELYPSWDAQNLLSLELAKKLGYSFSHEYPVYEIRRSM